MTSQQMADAALAIYQSNPRQKAEMLLNEFFGRVTTAEQYDRIQSRVSEEMSCVITEITTSPSPLPSSGAL